MTSLTVSPSSAVRCGTDLAEVDGVSLDTYVTHSATQEKSASWIGPDFARDWPLRGPLVVIAAVTSLLFLTGLDVAISKLFYDPGTGQWPWFDSTLCTWFYRRGIFPAIGILIFGFWLLLSGLLRNPSGPHAKAGLFLVLVFAIGPGLVVNTGFKHYWGRPRPHQLQEFGGAEEFVPVGLPGGLTGHNSSFPSGHAAVAFYLMTPGFLVNPRRLWLSRAWIGGGFLFGVGMGFVRVVQGGHFVSDVFWSAAMVYLTAVAVGLIVLRPRQSAPH